MFTNANMNNCKTMKKNTAANIHILVAFTLSVCVSFHAKNYVGLR